MWDKWQDRSFAHAFLMFYSWSYQTNLDCWSELQWMHFFVLWWHFTPWEFVKFRWLHGGDARRSQAGNSAPAPVVKVDFPSKVSYTLKWCRICQASTVGDAEKRHDSEIESACLIWLTLLDWQTDSCHLMCNCSRGSNSTSMSTNIGECNQMTFPWVFITDLNHS